MVLQECEHEQHDGNAGEGGEEVEWGTRSRTRQETATWHRQRYARAGTWLRERAHEWGGSRAPWQSVFLLRAIDVHWSEFEFGARAALPRARHLSCCTRAAPLYACAALHHAHITLSVDVCSISPCTSGVPPSTCSWELRWRLFVYKVTDLSKIRFTIREFVIWTEYLFLVELQINPSTFFP